MADEAGLADAEVVRLALVMNGGVSLAVWMGGVTHEIDRIRRAWVTETESVYAHVLKAVGCVVQVDVIGGASAGGINGAALAGAVAFDRSLATGRPITAGDDGASAWMRDLWLELGSFSNLLRPSFPEGPPSLMQGDEYFLTRLASAFGDLTKPGSQAVSAASRTIRYIATVTVEGRRSSASRRRVLDRDTARACRSGSIPRTPGRHGSTTTSPPRRSRVIHATSRQHATTLASTVSRSRGDHPRASRSHSSPRGGGRRPTLRRSARRATWSTAGSSTTRRSTWSWTLSRPAVRRV
jgi:hypothetical protein